MGRLELTSGIIVLTAGFYVKVEPAPEGDKTRQLPGLGAGFLAHITPISGASQRIKNPRRGSSSGPSQL